MKKDAQDERITAEQNIYSGSQFFKFGMTLRTDAINIAVIG